MRTMSILTAVAALAFGGGPARGGEAAAEPGTKAVFGFERAELERIGGNFKLPGDKTSWSQSPRKAPEALAFEWRPSAGYPYDLFISGEGRTEGELARARGLKAGKSLAALRANSPGVFRRSATVLRTCGWHRKALGQDWSSHPRLWVDVRSEGCAASIEIELEDDRSVERLTRSFAVPADRWVTLEFDLAGAAERRLLDPARMASVYVLAGGAEGDPRVLLDNFRLAAAEAKARLTLVRDESAWPVPPEPPSEKGGTTRPKQPAAVAVKPDLSPVPAGEKPATVAGSGPAWGNALHKVPRGIAAFDAKNLASVFMAPTGGMRVSSDGGKTWTGLGGKACTVIASGNNTPNRHGFFCTPTEVLTVYLTHCAGGGSPTETYFRRVAFDGARWVAGDVSVVDRDVRHCPEWHEVIRLGDGRLWAAWDHEDRFARIPIAAKFSDDGGRTWQHGGGLGLVSPPLQLGSVPRLAACGPDGAMLLYSSRRDKKVFWTRFDQKVFDAMYADYLKQKPDEKLPWDRFTAERSAWSVPEALPRGAAIASAVGMPDGRVFAAVGDPSAVLVWEEGRGWSESLAGCSGLLTRVGDDKVAVFYRDIGKDGRKILCRLLAAGAWSEPRTAAEEETAVKSLAVPQVSPPGFVPLAWSFQAGAGAVRTLRVPVDR